MYINPRKQRSFRKKLTAYTLLLAILISILLFFNSGFFLKRQLFISPIGKVGTDISAVKKNLKENNISFSDVLVLSDSYMVIIPNNGFIRLSASKDIAKQTTSLQRILRELTIEGKTFESIDFRFAEPVVSF